MSKSRVCGGGYKFLPADGGPCKKCGARSNETCPYQIGAMHQRIMQLEAKIDRLMLEYCPDEMTEEQKANWAKHQVPSK